MKLGVRKIRYIHHTKVADYSYLPAGSSFTLNSFLLDTLSDLPFVPETAEISENWPYDAEGKRSEFSLTAALRAGKDSYRPILQELTGRKYIFEVELISGVKYVIGSKEFLPTFTWTDGVSGISSSGFTFRIECKSLHGVLLDVPSVANL
ncbi:MAG: hypothetical protein IJL31_00055 [Oscillospiraceae bacterium]|nr:hypothetical protein [Bacillota bacterium]MBQ6029879.1 hypothetical protein [Oscillospiraceae bacterium]MBQ6243211.1 hypothetical protein [Bacteroidales bacterium]